MEAYLVANSAGADAELSVHAGGLSLARGTGPLPEQDLFVSMLQMTSAALHEIAQDHTAHTHAERADAEEVIRDLAYC
jgi:hypothetical protein